MFRELFDTIEINFLSKRDDRYLKRRSCDRDAFVVHCSMVVLRLPVHGLPRSRLEQLGRRRVGYLAVSNSAHLTVASLPMVEVLGPGHFENRQVGHQEENPGDGDNWAFDPGNPLGSVVVEGNQVAVVHRDSYRTWGVAWPGD